MRGATVLAGPADGRSAMSSLMILADGGEPPRFWSICLTWSFFRFDGESTPSHTAANARRWAAIESGNCAASVKLEHGERQE